MDAISIIGLCVGIMALVQAALYNQSTKKLNERTEQMQRYIENTINHSNLISMYSFLGLREMSRINTISNNKPSIVLTKDTIIFNKSANYSKNNADACKQIIFSCNIIKIKVYGEKVSEFLRNDDQILKITLTSELSQNSIEQFLSMSAQLLEYDICVLHNIHF